MDSMYNTDIEVDNDNNQDANYIIDKVPQSEPAENEVNAPIDSINILDNTKLPRKSGILLELGDIIEIVSPTNPTLHENTFYIMYIDSHQMKLINVASLIHYQINILDTGLLSDESITQINILNRSEARGYARQNNLLPNTWIDIHFGGDIPTIITGEISKIDEDMIEIITYPELNTIFIDFQYKGIPEHIPIIKLIIREKPKTIKATVSMESLKNGDEIEQEEPTMTYMDNGEAIIDIPDDYVDEPNFRDVLHELYTDADAIVFGENTETIYRLVEAPAHEHRHSIDEQVNDMMDELLSTIPNFSRTKVVLDNIHNLINKFKGLRHQYSNFDETHNITGIKKGGPFSKPLIDCISKFNMNMNWIIPVVSTRQKMYNTDGAYEAIDIDNEDLIENISQIESTQYNYNNATKNAGYGYDKMQREVNQLSTHYMEPINTDECIANADVIAGIDAIVDNLNDFGSSVYNKAGIVRRKYVVQKYNLDNNMIPPVSYTHNRICLKSLITLPHQFVRFSAISLPSTSLLTRVNLHQHYMLLHKLFNKHTEIVPHVIDDLSKELDYEQEENDTKNILFEGINEFILDKDTYFSENNKFNQFLETIIPKTKTLLNLFLKYIKNKFSIVDVVQQLEPFMIYTSDISYKQYVKIRGFINGSIKDYKVNMSSKIDEFAVLKNTKYNVDKLPNVILRILTEKPEFADMFNQTYTFLNKEKANINLSSHEVIYRMLNMDNSLLYTDLISSILTSLVVPNKLIDIITNPIIEDMTDTERLASMDCTKRVLTNIYSSVSALQKDNNKDDIWVDTALDDTPYDILKKYKDEQKRMMPEIFIEYLSENLIQRHDCPPAIATDLAKTMILNKKMVTDGNYALLEIKPQLIDPTSINSMSDSEKQSIQNEAELRKKTQYYRRVKNNWIKDDEIDNESFLDTSAIFCNIKNSCMKNINNNVCESITDSVSRFKKTNLNNMEKEFGRRINISVEELEKSLEKQIQYHIKMINRTEILRDIKLMRADRTAFEIGKRANLTEIIISPYAKTRDLILGQSDFVKKQRDICKFVSMFCREPIQDESPHVYYCNSTNVKLFPVSLFQLANTFVTGGDYRRKLNEICADSNIVAVSDDGDSIVDKHCGLVIKKLDFNTESGVDSGHDILEQDLGNITMNTMVNPDSSNKKPVFDSEVSETIYNIANAICSNIDIPMIGIYEDILRISNDLINTEILSETSYKKRSDISQNKPGGKPLGPYDKYRNETVILIVSCIVIIIVQTTTPSFKTNRTFPGCIRSFSGYPMDGVGDDTGIKYIACVLNKLKSSVTPWDSIKTLNADKLTIRMKSILNNQIMKRNDINDLYVKKREYILLNPDSIIPEEHSISKWTQFLPPVLKFSIGKQLQPIAPGYHKEIIERLRKGSYSNEIVYMLSGKMIQYGYGIIESINDIVKEKDLLLKTANQTPFLENACCNETNTPNNPINYFIEHNKLIGTNINSAIHMTNIMSNIRSITRSPFLYHAGITGQRIINPATGYTEETIYNTIIHYCNFDKNLPIPQQLHTICNVKPDSYNPKLSILEKVELLKKSGKRYNTDSVGHLMNVINRNNVVDTNQNTPTIDHIGAFKDIISHLDKTNSDVIPDPLRTFINNVIDQYKPNIMHDKPTPEITVLNDYLIRSNQMLHTTIMEYFNTYGNKLETPEFIILESFLLNISSWENDKNNGGNDDSSFYSVVQYMQNAILMISKIYPVIILQNSNIFKKVPKHWNLSKIHELDIRNVMTKYYSKLEEFKGDVVLLQLIEECIEQLTDLNLFVKTMPIQSDIIKQVRDVEDDNKLITARFYSLFNKPTIYLLLTHCLYKVLHQFMVLSDNTDLLNDNINEVKKRKRTEIVESKNPSNNMKAIPTNSNAQLDVYEDLNEVQIILGNMDELKQRVCSLLISLLDIEQKNKKSIDLSYSDIMTKVRRVSEREKHKIVKLFGEKEKDERGIEFMLKEFRIGRWNVGQQKGLVTYDKKTYDRERAELNAQTEEDYALGEYTAVTELTREIFNMDADDEAERDNEEQDELRFDGLGEDYMDGDPDIDGQDDDDF